jgi:hypothetical protein
VAQQHGERVQGHQGVALGGVKVQAEVDDVVGQPAGGEEHGQDDHHEGKATPRQHLAHDNKHNFSHPLNMAIRLWGSALFVGITVVVRVQEFNVEPTGVWI